MCIHISIHYIIHIYIYIYTYRVRIRAEQLRLGRVLIQVLKDERELPLGVDNIAQPGVERGLPRPCSYSLMQQHTCKRSEGMQPTLVSGASAPNVSQAGTDAARRVRGSWLPGKPNDVRMLQLLQQGDLPNCGAGNAWRWVYAMSIPQA